MQYTINAHIKHGDNGVLELFEREFEAINSEGEATKKACQIVLERVSEGNDWFLVQLFLISEKGIEKITWFDMCVAFNLFLQRFRNKVSSADNQQGSRP